ncbi:MAG: histidine phosphatase family protein [Bacteroidetes bacterium]|nr:histidine phosphatase family protein [Bacteroidota bacterium]
MKYLYVARHAKSSWTDFTKPDFERPLNERGRRDAPIMAKRVLDRRVFIDAFISSPAKRAKSTCEIFCEVFHHDKNNVIYMERLYHASMETFYDIVRGLDNKYISVILFSHNPGISEFVNSLCENVRVDNVPTCGVYGVELDITRWASFKPKVNSYRFFDYPKANY